FDLGSEFVEVLAFLHYVEQDLCVRLPETQERLIDGATGLSDCCWAHTIHPPLAVLFLPHQRAPRHGDARQETIAGDRVLQCDQYWMVFQIDSYFSSWQNFPPLGCHSMSIGAF